MGNFTPNVNNKIFAFCLPIFSRAYFPVLVILTVHGQLDGDAASIADGILYQATVNVIVGHKDSGDGEHFLIMGEDETGVIAEGFAVLQPRVGGLCAIFMGAIQGEIFT